MTEMLAQQIRYQRVDLGRCERDIAWQFTGGRTDSQLVGRDLIQQAARVLGEDGRRHPWNLKAGEW